MSTAHKARKRFGQNFLQDTRIITDIVNAVRPQPDDIVIEIGPGLAAITEPLTSKLPEWLDPADILHMREGDVATFTPKARLNYVGHLQCSTSIWNADCHENTALPLSAQQAKRYSGLKSQ